MSGGREYADYEADVVYDVWRSGGNVDWIDSDQVRGCYDDGLYQEETADLIVRNQMQQIGDDAL